MLKEGKMGKLHLSSASWMSNDQPIGEPIPVVISSTHFNGNSSPGVNSIYITQSNNTAGEIVWIGDPPYNTPWVVPNTGTHVYPPYNPIPTVTTTTTMPTIPYVSPPSTDKSGNKVIKATAPTLEQILVEIAKVLRDRGDILEIRTIFERYKLKLVDHDGEVIFNSSDIEKLENKGF
jgi:hypothetical protein